MNVGLFFFTIIIIIIISVLLAQRVAKKKMCFSNDRIEQHDVSIILITDPINIAVNADDN